MITILATIVLLGVLITAHELGHFIVAKLSNVRVLLFSIGFGKALVKINIGETEYRIAWLPLGGYVRMAGMEADEGESDVGRRFNEKPPWIRVLIALAGPAMNLILPFFILVPYFVLSGDSDEVESTVVGAVDSGLPAGKAGLRPGGTILEVDGEPVQAFWQISDAIESHDPDGPAMVFKVRHAGGAEEELTIKPEQVSSTHPLLGYAQIHNRVGYMPLYLAPDVAVTGPDTPAARAGLRTFDRIISVDGQKVAHLVDALIRLRAASPGQSVALVVERESGLDSALPFLTHRKKLNLTFTGADGPLGMENAGPCVTSVDPDGPAAALVSRGDCLVSVDGAPHSLEGFVLGRLHDKPTQPKQLEVRRADGRVETVTLALEKVTQEDPLAGELTTYRAGFRLLTRRDILVPAPRVANEARFAYAWAKALNHVAAELGMTLHTLGGIFTGSVSANQLSGPLTIAYLAGEHAKAGVSHFIRLMVLISISLALLNLLPVPGLDGGHILVAAIEVIIRRPLPPKVQEGLQRVGVAMLIALIIFALSNDVVRLWRLRMG